MDIFMNILTACGSFQRENAVWPNWNSENNYYNPASSILQFDEKSLKF